MYNKIKMPNYPLVILLILTNIFTAICQERGSLTFVIDSTRSMRFDIQQVKESADAITQTVFEEKASQIQNMVLVTFNDPDAKLEIETESREELKQHINNITAKNTRENWDCEEPSMKGVLLGLQHSLAGSYMYVFTDASAKDYWKSREIKNLCQKKQTQITFVLTGHCNGQLDRGFQVYYDIATACSGLAFYVTKADVNMVLTTIKETIRGNKTVITAVQAPPGQITNIPFEIDDETEYVIISASGSGVTLSVTGPRAVQKTVMWIRNAKVIKLINPTPGTYTAQVRGFTETSVYVVGKTDFLFSHGFSALEPESLKDTTPQPIADTKTHLLISVSDPKHAVNITSAQILDMKEKVIRSLPLTLVAKDFYTTTSFIAPTKRFKIAVIGTAIRNGKVIRRVAKIPVTVQDPPKSKSKKPVVTISEGATTTVEYGKTTKLACKISAYPEPKIIWKSSLPSTLIAESSVVELPYEYISYLTIKNVTKGDTYSCEASNIKGSESKDIVVIVKEPFDVKTAVKGTTEAQYGKKATLICDITASVPIHISWTYEDDITGRSKELVSANKDVMVSQDGKQLIINKMDENMVGKYSCKASLIEDPSNFVIHTTHVKLGGLTLPEVSGVSDKATSKGSNVVIECRVSGVPQPTITWQFMAKDSSKFVSIPGTDNVLRISNVDEKRAGRYKCIAHNRVGDAEYVTTLTVQAQPGVTGVATKTTTEGSNVVIECLVSGIPQPMIIWQFMAKADSKFVSVAGSDNVLRISSVNVKNAGRYKCIAQNVLGTAEHVTTLTVHVLPKITGGAAKIVSRGSNVIIECNVSGVPQPTITWQFTANDISKFVPVPGSDNVLRISNVDFKHAGLYKCVAHNIVGDAEHITTLTVQELPKVNGAAVKIASKGSNVNIECNVSGSPQPTITWQFMAKADSKFVSVVGSDNVLRISSVNEKNTGRYKCIAQNVLGTAEHVTTLTIHVLPKITGGAAKIASRGSNVIIECNVSGIPQPTITWQFMANDTSKFVPVPGSENVLRISNVDVKHAGLYKCVAHNIVGDAEHITTLTVQELPKVYGAAVKIASKGSNVNIECNVSGSPQPTITWQFMPKDGFEFVYVPRLDNVLRISSVEEKHAGRYKCIAHNILGDAEHVTTLKVQVPPMVTGIDAKTASKGSNVIIECIISGIPEPTVSWQFMAKDGSEFVSVPGSDSVYRIYNVDKKNAGRYKCIARNVVGHAELVTSLIVQVAPEVTGIAAKTTSKGSSVTIECNVSGTPQPTITWLFMSNDASKFVSVPGSDSVLYISNVNETHAGRYKCVARNHEGIAEHVTTLAVQVLPTVIGAAVKTASKGSNVIIECSISGIPEPTVSWQFMARDTLDFVSIPGSDSVIRITNVDEKHAGRYKCIAHNVVGDTEHVTTLSVQDFPEVTGVTTKIASKNSDVVIECNVSGMPQPTITWQFAAKDTSKYVSIPGSNNMLRLSNVDETHAGRYKCVARNVVGETEHVTTLTVQDLPKVTGVEAIMTSKDYDVVIECNVSGIPQPTITWKFAAIDTSKFVSIPGSDSVLRLSNVDKKHAGLYKCIARNVVGEAEHVTSLTVNVLPDVTGLADQTASKGSNVIIQCSVSGLSKPTITWQFMAINGSRFETIPGSDSVLRISNVREKHAGRYKCIAHNIVGEVEHVTTLTVQVLPKVTGEAGKIATKGSNVNIECDVSGIPQPTITWQFMGKNDSKFVAVPGYDDVLSLSNIDEKHAGLYKCVAQNVLGSAEHVTALTVYVLPEVTGAAATIASKGSNIIIECNVYGIPQPKIYWKFMASDASTFVPIAGFDSVLRISNVEEKHAGRYKCIAYNIVGEVEHVTTLTIQVLPKVTGVTATTAVEESNVTIECNVSGTPHPSVTWQFAPDDTAKFVSIPGSDNVLNLSNVDEKHAGLYKCIAHNIAGEAEHITTLYVQVAPKVTGVPTKAASKGSGVDIECNVTGIPQPSIIWLFAAKDDMPVHIPGFGKVLRIPIVDEKHAGRYTCMALNVLGTAQHNTILIVNVPPTVTGDATRIASKGSNADIECNVTGVPQPTVTWQFMNKNTLYYLPIPGSNNVLRISNVDENDAGSYKCVAHNIAGYADHVTTLNIQVLPEFTTSSVEKTSKEGSNVTIECNVTGTPKPTVTWQFMAKDSSKFVSVPGSDNVLYISNVDEKKAGLYKCIAHNVVGDTEHITTLNVEVPPQITDIASMIYESVEGKDDILRIPCTTTGWPKPVITWKLNGAVISKSEKYLFEDGALIIKGPQISDSHTYTCEATNGIGFVTASFQAKVLRPPKVSGKMTQIAKQALPVTITCIVTDGIPQPTVTWEFMAQDGSEFVSISESDYELRIWNVEEKHAGRYKCVAHNVAGDAEYVTTLIVQAPPKIISKPTVVYKSVEERDAMLRIPCTTSGLPKPTITWKLDDTVISQSEKYAIEDGALIIKNPKLSDSNTYKCEATNEVGSATATFQADVLQAPKITGVNEMKVHSGESVKIECMVVKGVPTPKITWQFKGKLDSNFIEMPGSDNVMYISDVEKPYAGHYKCIAHNDVGTAEHATNLIVQYAPRILSRTKKLRALEGDVALRIPCRADGEPKPTITWTITPGAELILNEHYTIMENALLIMHPRQDDAELLVTCEAKNSQGSVKATFEIQVDAELTDFGTINAVNILHGTSKKLECGSTNANQSIRWFRDGEELESKEISINLVDVNESSEGNYTCRVSDMKGAHTMTFAVEIGYAPFFSFEQNNPVVDWDGSDEENDMLDCVAESNPPADIVWTYNGKELERHNNDSFQLPVSGNWGKYSCKVSNVHGSIQRSFEVISSKCLIKRNPNNFQTMPLILSQDSNWPILDSTEDYLKVPSGHSVTFSCPNTPKNTLKLFPTMTKITAICAKQDIFIVNGKELKLSDLQCAQEIDAVVVEKPEKCLTDGSKLMRVGYEFQGFLETYEVCFDTSKNMPLYSRVTMYKSNRGRSVTQNWYKYPGIGTGQPDGGYTCANETATCCYSKTQLVNARDVSDGPAQKSTFIDHLNAVPYWRPCEKMEDPWRSIENKVRYQLSINSKFVAWSGVHKLQEKNGHIIPRYLWKVLRFNEEESIAVVYVNDPSPSEEDTLCANICVDDKVSWFGELDKNTYCCDVDEFLKAFDLYDSSVGVIPDETVHIDIRAMFEE